MNCRCGILIEDCAQCPVGNAAPPPVEQVAQIAEVATPAISEPQDLRYHTKEAVAEWMKHPSTDTVWILWETFSYRALSAYDEETGCWGTYFKRRALLRRDEDGRPVHHWVLVDWHSHYHHRAIAMEFAEALSVLADPGPHPTTFQTEGPLAVLLGGKR